MSIKNFFLKLIGKRPKPETGHRIYQISDNLQVTLSSLAQREGLPEDEFTSDIVAAGLVQYLGSAEYAPKWQTLTKREKEVAKLVGQGLTNRQIAGQLSLSTHTVNAHVQNIMGKFGVESKADLRHILALIRFRD
jgi:DNA-binding CsgD family transcriptional regulator